MSRSCSPSKITGQIPLPLWSPSIFSAPSKASFARTYRLSWKPPPFKCSIAAALRMGRAPRARRSCALHHTAYTDEPVVGPVPYMMGFLVRCIIAPTHQLYTSVAHKKGNSWGILASQRRKGDQQRNSRRARRREGDDKNAGQTQDISYGDLQQRASTVNEENSSGA
jgi:hypothetical protein